METSWQIPFSKSLSLCIVLAIVAQFFVDRTLEALDALFSVFQIITTPLTPVYALILPLPFALTHVLLGTLLLLFACAVVTALLLCGHVVEFVFDDEGSLLVDVVDCPDPLPTPPPAPLPYPRCIRKPRRPQLPVITITPPPPSELELRDLRIREAVEERDRTRWKVELSWLQSNESALVAADPKAYREAHKKVKARASQSRRALAWILCSFDDRTYSLYPKTLKDIQSKGNYEWAIAAIEKHRLARETREPQIAERLRLKEEEWAAKLQLSELPQRPVEVAGEESSGSHYIDTLRIQKEEPSDASDIPSEADISAVIPKDLEVVIAEQHDSARGMTPVNSTHSTPSTPLRNAPIAPVTPLILVELVSSNHDHGTLTARRDRPEQSHSDAAPSSPYTDGPSTPVRSRPPSSTPIIVPSPSCACTGRSHRGCGFPSPLPGLSDSSDFGYELDTSDIERSSSLPTSPILEPKHYFQSDEAADDLCDLFHRFSLSPAQDVSLRPANPQVLDCALSNGTFHQAYILNNSPALLSLALPSPFHDIPDLAAGPESTPIAFEPNADIFSLAAALGSMPLATLPAAVPDERMDDGIQKGQTNPAFTSERREPIAMDGVVAQQPIPQSTLLVEAPSRIFANFQFAISIPPQNVVPVISSWQYSNERMDAEPANSARMVTDSGDDNHNGDGDFVSMITDQTTQTNTADYMTIDANEISPCLPPNELPISTVLANHLPNDFMEILPESSHHVQNPFVDVQMAGIPLELSSPVQMNSDLLSGQFAAMESQPTLPMFGCDLVDLTSSSHPDAWQTGSMDASSTVINNDIQEHHSQSLAHASSKAAQIDPFLFDVAAAVTPIAQGHGFDQLSSELYTASPLDNAIHPQSLPTSGFKIANIESPFRSEDGVASTSEEMVSASVIPAPGEHPDEEGEKIALEPSQESSHSASHEEEIPAKDRPTKQLPQRRLKLVLASSADPKDADRSPDDERPVDSNIQSEPTTVSAAPAVALGEFITPALPSTSQSVDSVSTLVAQKAPETSNLLRLRTKRGSLIVGRLPRGKPIPKSQAKFAEPGELVYVEDNVKDIPKPSESCSPSSSGSSETTTPAPTSMESNSPQVSPPVVSSPADHQIGTVAASTAWSRNVKSVNSRSLARKENKPKVEDEEAELAEWLASRAVAPTAPVTSGPIALAASSKPKVCQGSTVPPKSAEVKRTDNSRSSLEDASLLETEMLVTLMDTISDSRPVRGLPTRATRKSQTFQPSIPQKSTIAAIMMSTSEIVTQSASSAISFDFAGGAEKPAAIPVWPLEGDELEKTLTDAFEEIHHQDRTRERRLKVQGKPRTRR